MTGDDLLYRYTKKGNMFMDMCMHYGAGRPMVVTLVNVNDKIN